MANATVERVHVPGGAQEFHAYLILNAAFHHTSKLGAGKVDVGVKITLVYRSNGQLVAMQAPRTNVGQLDASGVDASTVRVMVKVPYAGHPPDPGTKLVGRAQMVTVLPGNVEVPFGPAE